MYFTVVVPISRPENLELVCEQLPKIVQGEHTFELVVMLDNNRISRFNTEVAIGRLKLPWRNATVYNTGRPAPTRHNVEVRRDRIAKTMNEAKQFIGGSHFIFGFEDDTVLPDGIIEKLLKAWQDTDTNVGMVQGLQVGRWGAKHLGAWRVDDVTHPITYRTVNPAEPQAVSEVDAGGFYCYLTATNLFKEIELRWDEPVGPDVYYGLRLRQAGHTVLTVMDAHCGHLHKGEILLPDDETVMVELYLDQGRWKNRIFKPGER